MTTHCKNPAKTTLWGDLAASDSQMPSTGPFVWKIRLFDATCFNIAPLADFDEEAAVLDSAQDAGVQVETLHRACTWFSAPRLCWHLPKLERMCCTPDKIARNWCCLYHYVWMFWLSRTGFEFYFGRNSWETTAWPKIHKASYCSKIPRWDNHNAVRHSSWLANDFGWIFAGPVRKANVRIMWGQTRGSCERKFHGAPGEILPISWKTQSSTAAWLKKKILPKFTFSLHQFRV